MKTILALFLIIILPPLQVFAQTTTLEGFVTDAVGVPSSGFLPGQELLVLTRQGVVELRADGTTSLLFSRPLGYLSLIHI